MELAKEIALQFDLAAAAIAIVALLFSIWTALRQLRLENESLRIQRDNDVLAWGNEAIDTLARLESLSHFDPAAPDMAARLIRQKIEYMAELSAAIDKGRMYFPNVSRDVHGTHKDAGYRGFRRPILDALVAAYDAAATYAFTEPDAGRAVGQKLNLHRRQFVSHLQTAVDPDRRLLFLGGRNGASVDQVEKIAIKPVEQRP